MKKLTDDLSILKQWIGRTGTSIQIIDARPADQLSMLFDQDQRFSRGDELPPLWHWVYFVEAGKQCELGYDGHLKLGGFLPPVSLPRRMWASGEFQFNQPLRIGDTVTRHSTICDVQMKQGKSGTLCFVSVEHHYHVNQIRCFSELHHIVYRDKISLTRGGKSQDKLKKPADDFDWTLDIRPDPVMLFRYSALTFNAHRIHYDRDFCTQSEGYPGLVFHGPLTATLLLNHAIQKFPEKHIKHYKFKAIKPVFDVDLITLAGKRNANTIQLYAIKNQQELAFQASLSAINS